jgi:hypothetical protein
MAAHAQTQTIPGVGNPCQLYEMKPPSPASVFSVSASAADVTVSAGVSHVIRALGISLPGTAASGFTIGSSFIRSLPKTVEPQLSVAQSRPCAAAPVNRLGPENHGLGRLAVNVRTDFNTGD